MGGGQMPAEGRFPALNVQDVLFCSRSTEWQIIGQTQRIAILLFKMFYIAQGVQNGRISDKLKGIVQAILYGCMQLPFKHVKS